MDATKFDQLPDLCLRKIFAFLGLRDLVRCRAVSRQFKYYVDHTKVTELVVTDKSSSTSSRNKSSSTPPENWFRTDRPIDLKNSISLKALKSAKSSPFKMDEQLKYLHFRRFNFMWLPDYEIVNGLKQLQHLEIFGNDLTRKAKTLVLPNLKVLVIQNLDSFVLKTPKLEVLSCGSMSLIQFEYPETIRRVDCENDGESYGELAKLRNLEVLHVTAGYRGVLDGISLSDFTGLKELNLALDFWRIDSDEGCEQYESSVVNILHERSTLQRDELKLYVNDVPLNDAKQLPDFDVLFSPIISDVTDPDFHVMGAENGFKFMNYRLLRRDSYPEVTSVNFSKLMRLDFEISEDFFDRFPRIQELIATNLIDREQFEWFLQNATALRELKLIETRLDQAFIDLLPKLCSRLTRLKFYENSGLVTNNIQFILRFEHLEVFETDRPLHSFDLAAAAFRRSAKLKRLLCRTGNAFVEIERSSPLEDNYTLRFFGISHDKETISMFETFGQNYLNWTQLEALYHSKTVFINAPEKRMRIKRAQLE